MKKVLTISYYWPPAGGGGIQRVLKFCKYLPQYGWEPVVLTVDSHSFSLRDTSFSQDASRVKQIYRIPAFEPQAILARPSKKKREASKLTPSNSFLFNLLNLVRLNLFIPDTKIGWYLPARRKGLEIIEKEDVDLIFSSAPPYTTHLIALSLKKATKKPWVADFRDPWLENISYNTAPRLPVVKKLNSMLERAVLENADIVTTVGPGMKHLLGGKHTRMRRKVEVIYNGYDPQDVLPSIRRSRLFHLSYFGTIYPYKKSWTTLLKVLKELIDSDSDFATFFRLRVIGNIHDSILTQIIDTLPTQNRDIRDYIDHNELATLLYSAQLLLLVIDDVPLNKLIITGKLFEYLHTGNPILALGPRDGDAHTILKEAGRHGCLDHADHAGIKAFITDHFSRWLSGQMAPSVTWLPQFERPILTAQLARLFDSLTPGS